MPYLIVAFMLCGITARIGAQEVDHLDMEIAASRDITARRLSGASMLKDGLIVPGPATRLEIPSDCDSGRIRFYKVIIGIEHASIGYTFAELAGQNLQIGGFTEPQVISLARWLKTEGTHESLSGLSRCLAFLLATATSDTVTMIGPSSEARSNLWNVLSGKPESRWAVGKQRIGTRVRAVAVITVAHSYVTEAFTPTHFIFLYDNQDELVAWSSRAGESWR